MPRVACGVVRSVLVGMVAALPGCGPSMPRGFDSPEPAVRIDAVVSAAAKGDRRAARDLIRVLDSDDPAARMLAIRALERITGETNGYDYAAPESQRREAVRRWQEWEAEGGGAPGGGGPDGPRDRSMSPVHEP